MGGAEGTVGLFVGRMRVKTTTEVLVYIMVPVLNIPCLLRSVYREELLFGFGLMRQKCAVGVFRLHGAEF